MDELRHVRSSPNPPEWACQEAVTVLGQSSSAEATTSYLQPHIFTSTNIVRRGSPYRHNNISVGRKQFLGWAPTCSTSLLFDPARFCQWIPANDSWPRQTRGSEQRERSLAGKRNKLICSENRHILHKLTPVGHIVDPFLVSVISTVYISTDHHISVMWCQWQLVTITVPL